LGNGKDSHHICSVPVVAGQLQLFERRGGGGEETRTPHHKKKLNKKTKKSKLKE
jgi:hypothetical protein